MGLGRVISFRLKFVSFKFGLIYSSLFALILTGFQQPAFSAAVYMFGGGERPNAAVKSFVTEAGSKILVVTWPTNHKQEAYDALRDQILLNSSDPSLVTVSHATEVIDEATKLKFVLELSDATAVFISGGDQNRALDIVETYDLFSKFSEASARGVVFAGTSAGTAMMSEHAMTGDGDLSEVSKGNTMTRRGLGFVPFLVDQHFLERSRHNRLMSAILDHPELRGVGVDEDMAVRYEARSILSFGASPTMVYSYSVSDETFCLKLLRDGQRHSF